VEVLDCAGGAGEGREGAQSAGCGCEEAHCVGGEVVALEGGRGLLMERSKIAWDLVFCGGSLDVIGLRLELHANLYFPRRNKNQWTDVNVDSLF
jgi:hypothetical protein